MSAPRIVFAGTPDFARHSLAALLRMGAVRVIAVYTQPDRPSGRGKQLHFSPVKQLALETGLPVFQPPTLRDPAAAEELRALAPDLMVVAAYGLLLPSDVLAIPRLGCINVHGSLLPRWRGAAPIERAIEAGDAETGITIMQMDEGMDTGAMLLKKACLIGATDTGEALRERLGVLGADALSEAIPLLLAGALHPDAQDPRAATHAPKLKREESVIDWHTPADVLARRVRAFNAANVCQTTLAGQALRIWMASAEDGTATALPGTILRADAAGVCVACGQGVLRMAQLQLPGGKPMDAAAMLNGRAALFAPGQRLGQPA